MKQAARIFAMAFVLIGFAVSSSATPLPERNKNCPPDPDAGWIVCRSQCQYPNTCQYNSAYPVGSYCWQAALVSGYPANACFSGDYDPCCDPNYQW
jgi:hypothetical protein